ncbi:MAG: hypothetical protein SGPRY_006941 [Prymnesium sp.]
MRLRLGRLRDIARGGLEGTLLVGRPSPADASKLVAVCAQQQAPACCAFLRRHRAISQVSVRTAAREDEAALLACVLTPFLRHSLETSGRYIPIASRLLDVSELHAATDSDGWEDGLASGLLPGRFQTAGALSIEHLLLEPASRADAQYDLLLTLHVEGVSCGRGCVDFDPSRLLCRQARARLRAEGRVDLDDGEFCSRYSDPSHQDFRPMEVRILPDLEMVRVVRISARPPIAFDRDGRKLLTAEGLRCWWGEEHGLWLSPQRSTPFCTFQQVDGRRGVAPAGVFWPSAAIRPVRRRDQIPLLDTLLRLASFLRTLHPLGATLQVKTDSESLPVLLQPSCEFMSAAHLLHPRSDGVPLGFEAYAPPAPRVLSPVEPEQPADDSSPGLNVEGDTAGTKLLRPTLKRGRLSIVPNDDDLSVKKQAPGGMEEPRQSCDARSPEPQLGKNLMAPPDCSRASLRRVTNNHAKQGTTLQLNESTQVVSYASCTVAELRVKCRRLGLKTSGNKDALLKLLNAHMM